MSHKKPRTQTPALDRTERLSEGEEAPNTDKILLMSSQWTGPLPPPGALADFNTIEPGMAGRIVAMAESAQQHQQTLERTVIDGRFSAERLGIICATLVAITALGATTYAASVGANYAGAGALMVGLASLVGVFLRAKNKKKAEPEKTPHPAKTK